MSNGHGMLSDSTQELAMCESTSSCLVIRGVTRFFAPLEVEVDSAEGGDTVATRKLLRVALGLVSLQQSDLLMKNGAGEAIRTLDPNFESDRPREFSPSPNRRSDHVVPNLLCIYDRKRRHRCIPFRRDREKLRTAEPDRCKQRCKRLRDSSKNTNIVNYLSVANGGEGGI